MVTINLKGGLGNQMFQYAAARYLGIKYKTKIRLNIEYFHNIPKDDVPRKYQLDIFGINQSNVDIVKSTNIITKLLQKISIKIFSDESIFNLSKILLKLGLPAHLNGYFQSEKYFIDIKNDLIKEFDFKNKMSSETIKIKELIEKSTSVCINVRRGDYLRPDYIKIFGVCDMNYYNNAISHIKSKNVDPIFCIFSDDPKWVKEQFKMENALFIGNDDFKDYEQMYLMTKCKHNIIANSSFAWWGAWLNQNPNKTVIAPKKWVLKGEKNFKDIVPSSWIRI